MYKKSDIEAALKDETPEEKAKNKNKNNKAPEAKAETKPEEKTGAEVKPPEATPKAEEKPAAKPKAEIHRLTPEELKEILAGSTAGVGRGPGGESKYSIVKGLVKQMPNGTRINSNTVKTILIRSNFESKHNAERLNILTKLIEDKLVVASGKDGKSHNVYTVVGGVKTATPEGTPKAGEASATA